MIARELTDDPVFGIMTTWRLEDFYPVEHLKKARRRIEDIQSGIVLVYGVGASLVRGRYPHSGRYHALGDPAALPARNAQLADSTHRPSAQ